MDGLILALVFAAYAALMVCAWNMAKNRKRSPWLALAFALLTSPLAACALLGLLGDRDGGTPYYG